MVRQVLSQPLPVPLLNLIWHSHRQAAVGPVWEQLAAAGRQALYQAANVGRYC